MEKELANHLNTVVFHPAELTPDAVNALEDKGFVKTIRGGLYRQFVDFKRTSARIADLNKRELEDREFPLRRILPKLFRLSSDRSSTDGADRELEELQKQLSRLSVTPVQAHREELSRYAHIATEDIYVRLTEKGKESLWDFLCSEDAIDEAEASRRIGENVQRFHSQCQAFAASSDVRLQISLASLVSDGRSFERFSVFDQKLQREWDHPDRHPFVAELEHTGIELQDFKSAMSLLSKRLLKQCPSRPERLFTVLRLTQGIKGSGDDRVSQKVTSTSQTQLQRAERFTKIFSRMIEANFCVMGTDAPLGARLASIRDDPHKVFSRVVECGKYVSAEPYQKRVACTILAHSDVYLNEKTDTAFDVAAPSVIPRASDYAWGLTQTAKGGAELSPPFSQFASQSDICVLSAVMTQMPGTVAQVLELYQRTLGLLLQCGYTTAIDKLALMLMDGCSEYGGWNRDFLFELATLCDGLGPRSIYFRRRESPAGASGLVSSRPVIGVSTPPPVEW